MGEGQGIHLPCRPGRKYIYMIVVLPVIMVDICKNVSKPDLPRTVKNNCDWWTILENWGVVADSPTR